MSQSQEAAPLQWQRSVTDAYTLTLTPMRTWPETNASQREHWGSKHRRHKNQRSATYYTLRHLLGPTCPWSLPLTITLCRIAPRQLDSHDGLPASLKHIADGVADYVTNAGYGQGQDRQEGLTWRYAQRRGPPHAYAVEIVLLPLGGP